MRRAGSGGSRPPRLAAAHPLLPPALLAVAIVSVLPVARLLEAGVVRDGAAAFGPALDVLSTRAARAAIVHSLETAVVSALLAAAAGTACAVVMTLFALPGRRSFSFFFVLSSMIAPQVTALAFVGLLGPSSPLLLSLGLAPPPGSANPVRGALGIIAVLALHHAPLAFIVVRSGLMRIPRDLPDAAAIDGASRFTIVRRVVLPLLRGHLAGATLLCFAAALGNFGIPAVLGMSGGYMTLPTLIYRRLSSHGPSILADVAVLSLPLLAVSALSVLAAARCVGRSTPLSDDRGVDGLWSPGAAARAAGSAAWVLPGIGLFLPLASLLAAALTPSFGMALSFSTLTAEHFVEVLFRQDVTVRAFRNSLLFSSTAAVICGILAVGICHALASGPRVLRSAAEAAMEFPYAIPGVVLSVAAILLLLRPLPLVGVSLYGTSAIIILAYVARFLPLAVKPISASLDQLDPAIEEAAQLCGAGLFQRLRHVVLPAVMPAVVAGGLMVFLIAFNELTVSALLWSRGTETVGVVLFSLEEAGLASTASAVGIVAAAVIAGVMTLLAALSSRLPAGSLPWR